MSLRQSEPCESSQSCGHIQQSRTAMGKASQKQYVAGTRPCPKTCSFLACEGQGGVRWPTRLQGEKERPQYFLSTSQT